jgi:hypothetical protein
MTKLGAILVLAGAALGGALLAGCQPHTPNQPPRPVADRTGSLEVAR